MTEDDDSKERMGSTASLETVESEDLSEVTEGSQPESSLQQDDYVNPRGVRFTPQEPVKEGNTKNLINYPKILLNLTTSLSEILFIDTVLWKFQNSQNVPGYKINTLFCVGIHAGLLLSIYKL